jgi:hypothetical protein
MLFTKPSSFRILLVVKLIIVLQLKHSHPIPYSWLAFSSYSMFLMCPS